MSYKYRPQGNPDGVLCRSYHYYAIKREGNLQKGLVYEGRTLDDKIRKLSQTSNHRKQKCVSYLNVLVPFSQFG